MYQCYGIFYSIWYIYRIKYDYEGDIYTKWDKKKFHSIDMFIPNLIFKKIQHIKQSACKSTKAQEMNSLSLESHPFLVVLHTRTLICLPRVH